MCIFVSLLLMFARLVWVDGSAENTEIADKAQLLELLDTVFGLVLPADETDGTYSGHKITRVVPDSGLIFVMCPGRH